uniref:Uncharacterized protein n=1 Tax=Populus davidiana TaxID=266767 RepID=A0A6M2EX56_9ROSI
MWWPFNPRPKSMLITVSYVTVDDNSFLLTDQWHFFQMTKLTHGKRLRTRKRLPLLSFSLDFFYNTCSSCLEVNGLFSSQGKKAPSLHEDKRFSKDGTKKTLDKSIAVRSMAYMDRCVQMTIILDKVLEYCSWIKYNFWWA